MKLRIAWIGRTRSAPIQSLTAEYLKRLSRYAGCDAAELPAEAALLKMVERSSVRTQPVLVLLDARGKQLTSEEIANFLDYHLAHDTQELLFAVGPADGWSDETRARAKHVLSFGKVTLPHELARVVLLEQLYRGFTILKGHPYHGGH
ncbi:MAG: 23S rRNA (pseudouridine(1915)-N(3))-methyltransferase RlmH [Acidobacteriota bacterium]|nr:23S rRNA (pseudouridine(1915)-N(3))-methyltransferase RlmH [Acidobacteriota bacterium]